MTIERVIASFRFPYAVTLAALVAGVAGCGGNDGTVPTRTLDFSDPPTASIRAASGASESEVSTVPGDAAAATLPSPPIVQMRIPFDAKRRAEMAAYAQRHYGLDTYRLHDPRVIVEHYTDNDSVQATYDTFANDIPDVELHELPQVCSHFVVDRDGEIVQFVPLSIMCRHTVGLNYAAIGIEHVGTSDQEILKNPRQMRSSLLLTAWLQCKYGIQLSNVIGHNESLSSPYHRENVSSLSTQTHGDWDHADMTIYRRRLAKYPC
jgi:hypothetical protein